MAYEKLSFSSNEVLTATKMNKVAENLERLKDGTAIDDDAITNDHLADDAVDTDQIVDDAVTSNKIDDGAIENNHFAADAADQALSANSTKPIGNSVVNAAVNNLQSQLDGIAAASDVVDTVGTKSALLAYDTSHLTENDIVKVLADESQNGSTSEYRWASSAWTLVGTVGPYYTKSEIDSMVGDVESALATLNTGTGV